MQLTLTAEPVGTLRAEIAISWYVSGCLSSGADVELLGEAGQVIGLTGGGATVPVISLTRPGAPMVGRFSFYARATCRNDGRTRVAGPYVVTDVVRATEITTLAIRANETINWMERAPIGGWAIRTNEISRTGLYDGSLYYFDGDNKTSGSVPAAFQRGYPAGQKLHPYFFPPNHTVAGPVVVTPQAITSTGVIVSYATINYVTGARATYINGSATLYNPPSWAYDFPAIPDAIRGWTGGWAHADGQPGKAWVARGNQIGLVDI